MTHFLRRVPHPSPRFLRLGVGILTVHTWTLVEPSSVYNPPMSLVDQIQKDIVTAMKAKEEARLSTLRMVKSALQLKTVEKMIGGPSV